MHDSGPQDKRRRYGEVNGTSGEEPPEVERAQRPGPSARAPEQGAV